MTWPPGDGKLNGWSVDMLDPRSGVVISNSVPLALAGGTPIDKSDYVATLTYLPVAGDASSQVADELLRLSPPTDRTPPITAPTILLSRSALGLFDKDRGVFDALKTLPMPVTVKGQVTTEGTPVPAAASVTIVATKITGIDPGVLASFVRKVDVGADGQFEQELLPGTYRVTAVPSASLGDGSSGNSFSAVSQPWIVACLLYTSDAADE